MSSLSGAVGIADHFSPCIFWWAMPAIGLPAGTCIPISASRPKRASSRMSGLLFLPSGMISLPSPKSPAVLPNLVSASYSFCSAQTEKPPLTRYLPWSPASYQPPLTSRL